MNKTLLIITLSLATILLGGCKCGDDAKPIEKEVEVPSPWQPMTNEEIISESKKCTDAGLVAQALSVEDHGSLIVKIQCKPGTAE